jgi:hypothetical protein
MKIMPKAIEKRLVDDVNVAWRWWSLRFNAVGLAILTFVQFDPNGALWAWNMMPYDVRRVLPPTFLTWVAGILFGLAMLSRVVKQKPPDCHG